MVAPGPPSSGAFQPVKVNVRFRCLMVALTTVVACIMTFNIIWLSHLLEDTRPRRPRTPKSGSTKILNKQEELLSKEIKPHCTQRKTLEDIKKCFPSVRQLERPDCQEIKDWTAVQRCLTGRFRTDNVLSHIHIVGERHSGTKFLTKELQRCFPRNTRFSFRVHRDFLRSKHFFQPILAGHDLAASFVIVMVRDPVDWVAAMREIPYHSPSHVVALNKTGFTPLPWADFVKKPWTLENIDEGWEWQIEKDQNTLCQENFHPVEVVPCQYNDTSGKIAERFVNGFAPLYEMRRDGSGEPFSSILELRNEKILNFVLELPLLTDLSGYMIIRYEDILRNGTQFVLDELREVLGLEKSDMSRCRAVPAQPERLGSRHVAEDFRRYIWEHLDSDMEHLLGYV